MEENMNLEILPKLLYDLDGALVFQRLRIPKCSYYGRG